MIGVFAFHVLNPVRQAIQAIVQRKYAAQSGARVGPYNIVGCVLSGVPAESV